MRLVDKSGFTEKGARIGAQSLPVNKGGFCHVQEIREFQKRRDSLHCRRCSIHRGLRHRWADCLHGCRRGLHGHRGFLPASGQHVQKVLNALSVFLFGAESGWARLCRGPSSIRRSVASSHGGMELCPIYGLITRQQGRSGASPQVSRLSLSSCRSFGVEDPAKFLGEL